MAHQIPELASISVDIEHWDSVAYSVGVTHT